MKTFSGPAQSILRKEIIFALAVKGVLLFLLWKFCFSHPLEHLRNLDVVRHLLGR